MKEFTPISGNIVSPYDNDGERGEGEWEFSSMTMDDRYFCHSPCRTWSAIWDNVEIFKKWRELEECIALGARIEIKLLRCNEWVNYEGNLKDGEEYRIKGGISIKEFKKHYKTIIAFWSGAYVKTLSSSGNWVALDYGEFDFLEEGEYRPYLPKGSIVEAWNNEGECLIGSHVEVGYVHSFREDGYLSIRSRVKSGFLNHFKNFTVVKYHEE